MVAIPIAALAAATGYDLKERRIPNLITGPLALIGLLVAGFGYGSVGLLESLKGLALLLGFFFALWYLGTVGAGDAKLAAALGAWLWWDLAYPYMVVWVVLNAVVVLYLTLRSAGFSVSRWWRDQHFSVKALFYGITNHKGAPTYPGAVTLSLAFVIVWFAYM